MFDDSFYPDLYMDHDKIGELVTPDGTYRLWESRKWGDEEPAVVTLDNRVVGQTWGCLLDFINDYTETPW